MRLSPEQVHDLHSVLKSEINNIPYKLYLYGSRIDDSLKGGDIDLLVVTNADGINFYKKMSSLYLLK